MSAEDPERSTSSAEDDRSGASGWRPATERDAWVPQWLVSAAGWSWRLIVIAAAILAVGFALGQIVVVVVPVFLALLVTAVLHPAVRWLCDRGWPNLLATWTVIIGTVAVVGAAGYGMWLRVEESSDELTVNLEQAGDELERWLVDTVGLSQSQVDSARAQLEDTLTGFAGGGGGLSGARTALEVLSGIFIAVVVAFFFLKDGHEMWRWIVASCPERLRHGLHGSGVAAWTSLSHWVQGTAVVALVDAIFIGLAIWLLGVPLVVPLTVITFVAAFFPFVGAIVAGALAVLVAFAAEGLTTALILLAVVFAVQQLEGNIMQPIIVSRAVSLHPVAIILALAAGAAIAGIVGAFLAVPTLAAVYAVGRYLRRVRSGDETPPDLP